MGMQLKDELNFPTNTVGLCGCNTSPLIMCVILLHLVIGLMIFLSCPNPLLLKKLINLLQSSSYLLPSFGGKWLCV